MANMSYCKFQNTLSDLRDCRSTLEELFEHRADRLSSEETEAAKRLLVECRTILELAADYAAEDLNKMDGQMLEAAIDDANEETGYDEDEDEDDEDDDEQ